VVGCLIAALCFNVASLGAASASSNFDPAGQWHVTAPGVADSTPQTQTFIKTGPDTYTVTNGGGYSAPDTVVEGDSATAHWDTGSNGYGISIYHFETHADGPATFTGTYRGYYNDGSPFTPLYPQAGVSLSSSVLSVSKVDPGTDPLSVDVHVKFNDSSSDTSDCDEDATYDFSDAELDTSKEVSPCDYELTFKSPGTGIYHVGLKATNSSGDTTDVSRDQYGDKVDGKFTVIVDSCSEPEQAVPDIDSLLNSDDTVCDLEVGDWDSDAASVASRVIADADSSASLEFSPESVDSIDPSDWPVRGPAIPSGSGVGWLPTGVATSYSATPYDGTAATGVGNAVALVQRLHVKGVPDAYLGGPDSGTFGLDSAPPAKVLSAHGWWYTPNGLELVPKGDTITTFVPIGTSMGGGLGIDVDTGILTEKDHKYEHVYKSGHLMPNFSFAHLSDAHGQYVWEINGTTTLNALLTTVDKLKGTIWISACADVYIPVGQTPADALKDLPVHSPGVETTDTNVSVQISSRGVLVVAK